jgi:RND family efflux transporter MFP subunit
MKSFLLPRTAALFRAVSVLSVVSIFLSLIGCAPAATATPFPILVPEASNPEEAGNVQASAEVVPAQEAHLSFVVSGTVAEITVEIGDLVEAGQVLMSLQSPELEYGLVQAEAAVRAAEFDYKYWQLPRRVGLEVVERGQVAEKELEQARRSLETAQVQLSQTGLAAPFAATVVSIEVQLGEFVQPGQVVITLAKLDQLIVETTDLSELNVAAVTVGQQATVHVEALDKELPGVVSAISPIFNIIGSDVVYTVTILLEEQPADLLWGMSADVEIKTE